MFSDHRHSGSVVGVVTDFADVDGAGMNSVRTRYLEALTKTAGVIPLLLPTALSPSDIDGLIEERLDGVVLTGACSNVHPARYAQTLRFEEQLTDRPRDQVAVTAIRSAVRHRKPLFGICRGLQEINVAFGGTLHQDLSAVPGTRVHHEDISRPRDEQYRHAHPIELTRESGLFQVLRGGRHAKLWVNSLHRQAIDRLGDGLAVEAVAPDGVIEAISAISTAAPVFGVQWHIEWFHETDPVSRDLLRAFGKCCDRESGKRSRAENRDLAMCFRNTLAGL